jgi:S1-C subfamily serine protease
VPVLQPYRPRESCGSSVGTGFVINVDGRNVVATAFHVIDEATRVQLAFPTLLGGRTHAAHVLGGNPVLDVALLILPDDALRNVPALATGSSDGLKPSTHVSTFGYPLARQDLQSNKGTLSGRKAIPNRLQIDAPVNPGNSGGPLFGMDGAVVGIVTSGHATAQVQNYAAPMNESLRIFRRIVQRGTSKVPHFERGLDLAAHFARMSYVLAERIGCVDQSAAVGAFVTTTHRSCDPTATAAERVDVPDDELCPGEVLCAVEDDDGVVLTIDGQLRVRPSWSTPPGQPIEFHALLDRCTVELRDDGTQSGHMWVHVRTTHSADKATAPERRKLTLLPPREAMRERFVFCEPLPFVSRGGLVVQQLHEELSARIRSCRPCAYVLTPEMDMHSALVATHIDASSPFAEDDFVRVGDYVVAVNNVLVHSLVELAAAWREALAQGTLLTVRTRDGSLATVRCDDVRAYESGAPSHTVSADGQVSSVSHYGGLVGTV